MYYYIKEVFPENDKQKTARVKARADVEDILEGMGFSSVTVSYPKGESRTSGLGNHLSIIKHWEKTVSFLKKGDVLVIQFPIITHSVFWGSAMGSLKNKGVYTILIVHDLEILRNSKKKNVSFRAKIKRYLEEIGTLKKAGAVIVHNENMKVRLIRYGVHADKMIPIGIFDYLIPGVDQVESMKKRKIEDPIIIAGNLDRSKAEYVYKLDDTYEYNLYGIRYEGAPASLIHYHGAFSPEELPLVLEGSFGLIWDGESIDTCTGVHGEYLKINNPHKTSLYLAAGLPVIVWNQAAIADFVLSNHVGFSINSLFEARKKIQKIDIDDYQMMCRNAEQVSKKLRAGFYLKNAVDKAISRCPSYENPLQGADNEK